MWYYVCRRAFTEFGISEWGNKYFLLLFSFVKEKEAKEIPSTPNGFSRFINGGESLQGS